MRTKGIKEENGTISIIQITNEDDQDWGNIMNPSEV